MKSHQRGANSIDLQQKKSASHASGVTPCQRLSCLGGGAHFRVQKATAAFAPRSAGFEDLDKPPGYPATQKIYTAVRATLLNGSRGLPGVVDLDHGPSGVRRFTVTTSPRLQALRTPGEPARRPPPWALTRRRRAAGCSAIRGDSEN